MGYEGLRLASGRSTRLAEFYERQGLVKQDGVLVTTAEAKTRSPAASKSKPTSPSASSGYDVQRAATNARVAERRRWEAVMLSGAAKGRELCAAAMLSSENSSADVILAKLVKMPTDAERAQKAAAEKQARAAATWDRAIADVFGTEDRPESRGHNHGWAGIHDDIRNRRA